MAIVRGRNVVQQDDDELDLDDPEERSAFEPDGDEADIPTEGEMYEVPVKDDEEIEEKPTPALKKPLYAFETQEELDAYIEAKNRKVTPAPITPTVKEPEEDEVDKLEFWKGHLDENGQWVGEAPKDWNDFARTIIKQVDAKKQAPKILSEIQNLTKAQQADLDAINAEFDAEFDELAAQGLVPKRGTPEGDAANAAISAVGSKYGQTSMKTAYELWESLPKEKGGKVGAAPVKKANPSKQVARLIRPSRGSQAGDKPKSKRTYAQLHQARDVAELVDED